MSNGFGLFGEQQIKVELLSLFENKFNEKCSEIATLTLVEKMFNIESFTSSPLSEALAKADEVCWITPVGKEGDVDKSQDNQQAVITQAIMIAFVIVDRGTLIDDQLGLIKEAAMRLILKSDLDMLQFCSFKIRTFDDLEFKVPDNSNRYKSTGLVLNCRYAI